MIKFKFLAAFLFLSFIGKANGTDSTYIEEQVTLHTSKGDIKGTLLIPKTSRPIPVSLIIAGSGPTDRDGNNPMAMSGVYKKLAYNLAASNIATLRYDKRGIGESKHTGETELGMRFTDYVSDAKDWIDLLKKDKRFSKVIVIGHSEGSLIGMIAATHADKYISISGLGQSADITLKKQLSKQPQNIIDMVNPMLDTLKKGDTLKNVSPLLYSLFRPSIQPYMISWFAYDPQIEIKKLSIPILILQGTNDLQVTVEDANLLKNAAPKAELVLITDMNHILRIIKGDVSENIKSYNEASLPLAEELTSAIISFIKK
jgi:uncharacterized protein